jgi:hypothetical protein
MQNLGFYFNSVMENTVPFLLAWEAYVFFMLLFFLSIVIRLNRIEYKLDKLAGQNPRQGLYYKIVKLWRSI